MVSKLVSKLVSRAVSWIRRGVVPLLIVAVSVVFFVYFKATKPVQPPVEIEQKVWPIKVVPVEIKSHSAVLTLFGQVVSNALVSASSPVNGVVERVWVRSGSEFKKGDVLVALASTDLSIPVQSARADVADFESQVALEKLAFQANLKRLAFEKRVLALKQNDLRRNKKLLKKDLSSQFTLDRSSEAAVRQAYAVVGAELLVSQHALKLQQLQARLDKARAQFSQAVLNKQRGVVVAPFDGRVASVSVSAGDRVSVGMKMVSFYGFNSLQLKAKVPVNQVDLFYAPKVSSGALAESIEDKSSIGAVWRHKGEDYLLAFDRLGGQSTASGVEAYFNLPQDFLLARPGDLWQVSVSGRPQANTFAVPYSALYGSNQVYSVKQGHLVRKRVQNLGETLKNGQAWALLKGDFSEGERVMVTHLPNAITGLAVSVVRE